MAAMLCLGCVIVTESDVFADAWCMTSGEAYIYIFSTHISCFYLSRCLWIRPMHLRCFQKWSLLRCGPVCHPRLSVVPANERKLMLCLFSLFSHRWKWATGTCGGPMRSKHIVFVSVLSTVSLPWATRMWQREMAEIMHVFETSRHQVSKAILLISGASIH